MGLGAEFLDLFLWIFWMYFFFCIFLDLFHFSVSFDFKETLRNKKKKLRLGLDDPAHVAGRNTFLHGFSIRQVHSVWN